MAKHCKFDVVCSMHCHMQDKIDPCIWNAVIVCSQAVRSLCTCHHFLHPLYESCSDSVEKQRLCNAMYVHVTDPVCLVYFAAMLGQLTWN